MQRSHWHNRLVSYWYATSFPAVPGADPEAVAKSPDADFVGFTWVPSLPVGLISKEIDEMMKIQRVGTQRTCGYWYQREGVKAARDRKAEPGEKIILHFHGA